MKCLLLLHTILKCIFDIYSFFLCNRYYKFKVHFNSFYKKILKDYFMYCDALNLVIKYICVYNALIL